MTAKNCTTHHECDCIAAHRVEMGATIQTLRGALQLYACMEPEKVYSEAGMTEDETVAELTSTPEGRRMLVKMDGGRLAREVLASTQGIK